MQTKAIQTTINVKALDPLVMGALPNPGGTGFRILSLLVDRVLAGQGTDAAVEYRDHTDSWSKDWDRSYE